MIHDVCEFVMCLVDWFIVYILWKFNVNTWPDLVDFWKLFVSAPSPRSVDARSGLSVIPSHLVPLSASVAVKKKKKKKSHERDASLADSRNSSASQGYASPLQPPVTSDRSRSPSVARSRGRSVPANHSDSFYVQPTHASQGMSDQATPRTRPASRGNRSHSKSVNFTFISWYIAKDCLFLSFYCTLCIILLRDTSAQLWCMLQQLCLSVCPSHFAHCVS